MRYRGVFFDVGETLLHPAPSFPELFASILARAGHVREPDEVADASRIVIHRFSEAARGKELWTTSPERSRRFWTGIYAGMLNTLRVPGADGLPRVLYQAFTEIGNYALFDDVLPMLQAIAGGEVVLGIVSNFEAWLDDLLAALGVQESFPIRVISGVEGIEKPDPEIYELALARAGIAPADAVFVGDNPEFDVDPPRALGMFTVLIDRRGRHLRHDGARIENMGELTDLLAAS